MDRTVRPEDFRELSATERWAAFLRHAGTAGTPPIREEAALVREMIFGLADAGKLGDTDRGRLGRRLDEGFGPEDPWERVAAMDGLSFEGFMARFFKQNGHAVERTPPTGDFGADLVLEKAGSRVAVELKRYAAGRSVSAEAVRAVYSGMSYYEADEAWVVSTARFTLQARRTAALHGVRLVDGEELMQWLYGWERAAGS